MLVVREIARSQFTHDHFAGQHVFTRETLVGKKQRRLAVVILNSHAATSLVQRVDDVDIFVEPIAHEQRQMERRVAQLTLSVHVGAIVEQQLHHVKVHVLDGIEERRVALGILRF